VIAAFSWTVLAVLLVLGVAPEFVVRLLVLCYPKEDPRRQEHLAEMRHIDGLGRALQRWYWMANLIPLAMCEGLPARRAARRRNSEKIIGPIRLSVRSSDGTVWEVEGSTEVRDLALSGLPPRLSGHVYSTESDGALRQMTLTDALRTLPNGTELYVIPEATHGP
jgi:hypothetical protein